MSNKFVQMDQDEKKRSIFSTSNSHFEQKPRSRYTRMSRIDDDFSLSSFFTQQGMSQTMMTQDGDGYGDEIDLDKKKDQNYTNFSNFARKFNPSNNTPDLNETAIISHEINQQTNRIDDIMKSVSDIHDIITVEKRIPQVPAQRDFFSSDLPFSKLPIDCSIPLSLELTSYFPFEWLLAVTDFQKSQIVTNSTELGQVIGQYSPHSVQLPNYYQNGPNSTPHPTLHSYQHSFSNFNNTQQQLQQQSRQQLQQQSRQQSQQQSPQLPLFGPNLNPQDHNAQYWTRSHLQHTIDQSLTYIHHPTPTQPENNYKPNGIDMSRSIQTDEGHNNGVKEGFKSHISDFSLVFCTKCARYFPPLCPYCTYLEENPQGRGYNQQNKFGNNQCTCTLVSAQHHIHFLHSSTSPRSNFTNPSNNPPYDQSSHDHLRLMALRKGNNQFRSTNSHQMSHSPHNSFHNTHLTHLTHLTSPNSTNNYNTTSNNSFFHIDNAVKTQLFNQISAIWSFYTQTYVYPPHRANSYDTASLSPNQTQLDNLGSQIDDWMVWRSALQQLWTRLITPTAPYSQHQSQYGFSNFQNHGRGSNGGNHDGGSPIRDSFYILIPCSRDGLKNPTLLFFTRMSCIDAISSVDYTDSLGSQGVLDGSKGRVDGRKQRNDNHHHQRRPSPSSKPLQKYQSRRLSQQSCGFGHVPFNSSSKGVNEGVIMGDDDIADAQTNSIETLLKHQQSLQDCCDCLTCVQCYVTSPNHDLLQRLVASNVPIYPLTSKKAYNSFQQQHSRSIGGGSTDFSTSISTTSHYDPADKNESEFEHCQIDQPIFTAHNISTPFDYNNSHAQMNYAGNVTLSSFTHHNMPNINEKAFTKHINGQVFGDNDGAGGHGGNSSHGQAVGDGGKQRGSVDDKEDGKVKLPMKRKNAKLDVSSDDLCDDDGVDAKMAAKRAKSATKKGQVGKELKLGVDGKKNKRTKRNNDANIDTNVPLNLEQNDNDDDINDGIVIGQYHKRGPLSAPPILPKTDQISPNPPSSTPSSTFSINSLLQNSSRSQLLPLVTTTPDLSIVIGQSRCLSLIQTLLHIYGYPHSSIYTQSLLQAGISSITSASITAANPIGSNPINSPQPSAITSLFNSINPLDQLPVIISQSQFQGSVMSNPEIHFIDPLKLTLNKKILKQEKSEENEQNDESEEKPAENQTNSSKNPLLHLTSTHFGSKNGTLPTSINQYRVLLRGWFLPTITTAILTIAYYLQRGVLKCATLYRLANSGAFNSIAMVNQYTITTQTTTRTITHPKQLHQPGLLQQEQQQRQKLQPFHRRNKPMPVIHVLDKSSPMVTVETRILTFICNTLQTFFQSQNSTPSLLLINTPLHMTESTSSHSSNQMGNYQVGFGYGGNGGHGDGNSFLNSGYLNGENGQNNRNNPAQFRNIPNTNQHNDQYIEFDNNINQFGSNGNSSDLVLSSQGIYLKSFQQQHIFILYLLQWLFPYLPTFNAFGTYAEVLDKQYLVDEQLKRNGGGKHGKAESNWSIDIVDGVRNDDNTGQYNSYTDEINGNNNYEQNGNYFDTFGKHSYNNPQNNTNSKKTTFSTIPLSVFLYNNALRLINGESQSKIIKKIVNSDGIIIPDEDFDENNPNFSAQNQNDPKYHKNFFKNLSMSTSLTDWKRDIISNHLKTFGNNDGRSGVGNLSDNKGNQASNAIRPPRVLRCMTETSSVNSKSCVTTTQDVHPVVSSIETQLYNVLQQRYCIDTITSCFYREISHYYRVSTTKEERGYVRDSGASKRRAVHAAGVVLKSKPQGNFGDEGQNDHNLAKVTSNSGNTRQRSRLVPIGKDGGFDMSRQSSMGSNLGTGRKKTNQIRSNYRHIARNILTKVPIHPELQVHHDTLFWVGLIKAKGSR